MDEIHRLLGIFQTVHGLIDRRRRKGKRSSQLLFLGSASIEFTAAGRIAYLELTPFAELEVLSLSHNATDDLWVRGGFPDSFLAATETASFEWRTAFIRTYMEHDVPSLGPRQRRHCTVFGDIGP
jgi:predicted AAA+ superfamily ATPase